MISGTPIIGDICLIIGDICLIIGDICSIIGDNVERDWLLVNATACLLLFVFGIKISDNKSRAFGLHPTLALINNETQNNTR